VGGGFRARLCRAIARPVTRSGSVALAALLAACAWLLVGRLSGRLSTERVGPRPSASHPVVVLLHGYGASGDDLVTLARELSSQVPDTTFVMPEGPHRVGLTGHSWVPDFVAPSRDAYEARLAGELAQTRAQLWKLIDDLRASGVPCEDIYLGGFSQGGRVAADAALRPPDGCRLGGLIVMSGGGLSAEVPRGAPAMRVLVTHGTSDGVVPLGTGLALAHALAADGHDVRWLQFDGRHEIPGTVRDAIPRFLRGEEVGASAP
jgi:phospholipase/carboxylesterase